MYNIRHFQTKSAASVAWPGPVGPSPDSDGTAPGGSILIHLQADPHRKWTKKNKASLVYRTLCALARMQKKKKPSDIN